MSTPFIGEQFTFTQPDGTELWVKGWGDQHHAVFETLNGYTVVKDPATGFYSYADISPDGDELVPTGARPRVANAQNLGVRMGLRVGADAARAAAVESPGLPIGYSRWEERRREARRAMRAAASAPPGLAAAPPQRQTVGDFTGICILIQFPDVPGTITRQKVDDFCNKVGYTGFGNNGSVFEYFKDVSGGKLKYKNIVTPYYTAKHQRSYYTNPAIPQPKRARELILEALNHFKAQGFDFSKLTADNQNFVYAMNVFYAGTRVNNWAEGLWPHSFHLLTPFALPSGKKAFDYQFTDMTNELTLGTFCHENGHMICDFPDLYDYGNESAGVGAYCLMCVGGNISRKNPTHIGAYLKFKAGWAQSTTPIAKNMSGTATAGSNKFFMHRKNTSEYFILENRHKSGRDAALPGSGLAIWHVDELGDNQNQEMTATSHYECTIEQADGRNDLESSVSNIGDATDLFSSATNAHFGDTTAPNSDWWDGNTSKLDISAIGASGPSVTFKATI